MEISLDALAEFVEDLCGAPLLAQTRLFPVGVTYPMGFSWSSAVAQDCMLQTCLDAEVKQSQILCDAECPPIKQHEVATVCTDNVMFFHTDATSGTQRLQQFDAAMASNGVPAKVSKSVDLASSITGLGCDFAENQHIDPSASEVLQFLMSMILLLKPERDSPLAVNRCLGVAQWFPLLNRPVFFCFRYGIQLSAPEARH